jgi:polynucleotide 5'-kinase involved in rRNA processing
MSAHLLDGSDLAEARHIFRRVASVVVVVIDRRDPADVIADLVERARRAPFLVVLGASGSGKTSVVRAGLIPMLKAGALAGSATWAATC